MSVEAASGYVDKLVRAERQNTENIEQALRNIARRSGVGFWQLHHLFKRKAKTCDSSLLARIRDAYIDHCAKQITALQLEIAIEQAVNPDDVDQDLAAEIAQLAEKIAQKKQARGGRS